MTQLVAALSLVKAEKTPRVALSDSPPDNIHLPYEQNLLLELSIRYCLYAAKLKDPGH